MESPKMLGYSWAAQKTLQGTAQPGMMAQACSSCLWNLKQDCRFRTSPGYTLRPWLKNQTTTTKKNINRKTSKQTNKKPVGSFLKMIVVDYNLLETKIHVSILTIN